MATTAIIAPKICGFSVLTAIHNLKLVEVVTKVVWRKLEGVSLLFQKKESVTISCQLNQGVILILAVT